MLREIFPYALYHGTSTHYLEAFRPGTAVAPWPHKEAALGLLRATWEALQRSGVDPDWSIRAVLGQESGRANFEHGQLYVSPSRQTAVRYAAAGGRFGGELLNFCRDSLHQLEAVDRGKAQALIAGSGALAVFLVGRAEPLLVNFSDVPMAALVAEGGAGDPAEVVEWLTETPEDLREVMSQQANFRLALESAIVTRVYRLVVEDESDPCSAYQLIEVA